MLNFGALWAHSERPQQISIVNVLKLMVRLAACVGLLASVIGLLPLASTSVGADGVTWTKHAASEQNNWRSVAFGNGIFVAVANSGTNRVMTSTDGISWTAQKAIADNAWTSVTFGNGLFVAVGGPPGAGTDYKLVMTSPDGINWTEHVPAKQYGWLSVTYGNGTFVAVAETGSNRTHWIMSSSDNGQTWVARTSPLNYGWSSVAFGDGRFVAVTTDSGTTKIISSPDGVTWTQSNVTSGLWTSVTYGGGKFVAVAYSGENRVATSTDGLTWSLHTVALEFWNSVAYGNGMYVSLGFGTNKVMTSFNGETWVNGLSAETGIWNSIAFGNGVFVAVSENAAVRVQRLQYPGAPTAPVVTNAACVDDEVELTVTQSSNGGSAISNYEYHIATEHPSAQAPTQWDEFSPAQVSSPLKINMRTLGKSPGLAYFFYVRAVNSVGVSPSSWIQSGGQSCVSDFELAPAVPVLTTINGANTGSVSSDNTPIVSVSGVLDGHTVTVTASKLGLGDVTCTYVSPASTGCELGVLADGEWSIVSRQTSSTGFVSEASIPFVLIVDTIIPVVESIAVAPNVNQITITMSELLGAETATTADFVATIDGAVVTITAVTISGTTVLLTLATAPTAGQLVSVIYRAPASDVSSVNKAIQDVAGNDAAAFTVSTVTQGSSSPAGGGVTSGTSPVSGELKPVLSSGGNLPRLSPGISQVSLNGVRIPTTLKVVSGSQLVLKGEDFELKLKGDCSGLACAIKTDSKGREVLELEKDGRGNVSGFGFKPDTKVHVWIFSQPRYLGALTVRADGTFNGDLSLKGIPSGQHTLQVNGFSFDNQGRTADLGIIIRGKLPVAGSDMASLRAAFIFLLIGVVLRVSRRRMA
jgi:hypothetical protein